MKTFTPRPSLGGGQKHNDTIPKAQATKGTVGSFSGHEGEAETSFSHPPRRPPSWSTVERKRPASGPLVGKRGTVAGWPVLGLYGRTLVEADDPREPLALLAVGAGQCKPPVMRNVCPTKQFGMQSKNNQVRQPPRAPAQISKRRWRNHTATSHTRSVRETRPTWGPRKPSSHRHGRSDGRVLLHLGRNATGYY